jgi:hypothetical protein
MLLVASVRRVARVPLANSSKWAVKEGRRGRRSSLYGDQFTN